MKTKTSKQQGQATLTPLRDGLLDAIRSRDLSSYELSRMTGLNDRGIRRFLKGERGLTLASADQLAAALGLRLVEGPARKSRIQQAAEERQMLSGTGAAAPHMGVLTPISAEESARDVACDDPDVLP